MTHPLHIAIRAAEIADDALNASIREAGFRDRWDFTQAQRIAHPNLNEAYQAKVAADRRVEELLALSRDGAL